MPDHRHDTVELFAQLRAGHDQAKEAIFERVLPPLLCDAQRRVPAWLRRRVDPRDLVQTVMVKALPRLSTFRPAGPGALYGYLRRALVRTLIDEMRAAIRRPIGDELPDSLRHRGPSPLEEAMECEDRRRYEAALRALSPRDRALIVARLDEQLGYEELAGRFGKPSGNAARVAVARALRRLADVMARGRLEAHLH